MIKNIYLIISICSMLFLGGAHETYTPSETSSFYSVECFNSEVRSARDEERITFFPLEESTITEAGIISNILRQLQLASRLPRIESTTFGNSYPPSSSGSWHQDPYLTSNNWRISSEASEVSEV